MANGKLMVNRIENTTTKSKKHASIGGAVANQIPTCIHMGVLVNIDGFVSEVVLISGEVDLSSFKYKQAQNDAQTIIAQLSAFVIQGQQVLPHRLDTRNGAAIEAGGAFHRCGL